MKHLLFISILILTFCASSFAQDEISLPRDVAEKALKALEVNPVLETKISALEKQVKELESAKLTPCAVSQEKVKLDVTYWLDRYEKSDEGTKKEIQKVLKQTLKLGSKSIQSQCGFESKTALATVWEIVKPILPVAAILLVK